MHATDMLATCLHCLTYHTTLPTSHKHSCSRDSCLQEQRQDLRYQLKAGSKLVYAVLAQLDLMGSKAFNLLCEWKSIKVVGSDRRVSFPPLLSKAESSIHAQMAFLWRVEQIIPLGA